MRLWRVSEYSSLDGIGGLVAPGRWHNVGRPILYMAEVSSLAMLEVLAGYDVAEAPETFQLLEIDAGDPSRVAEWPADQDHYDLASTVAWGDAFLRDGDAALSRVPSAIAPRSWNWLLNPLHPDAARVQVMRAERWPWDPRLFAPSQDR